MASEVPTDGSGRVRSPVILGGGIGAGKSSIGEIFAAHGYEVIVADAVGHEVLAAGSPAVVQVAERWPSAVVDGSVDRAALAAIVFADDDELARLEAITHPRIAEAIRGRIAEAPSRRILVEVPVQGVLGGLEAVRIAVVADAEVRLARAVARGNDRADVEARMAAQVDDRAWRVWADVVIDNTGAWAETARMVEAVIEELDRG